MDPQIGGELGVKGGDQHRALLGQDRVAAVRGKDLDAGTDYDGLAIVNPFA